MQAELPEGISILGVNEAGYESGNDTITEGRSLPWLQDTAEVDAWAQWSVNYRDVIIRDEQGIVFDVYNLTGNGLDEPANYADLMGLALEAAAE